MLSVKLGGKMGGPFLTRQLWLVSGRFYTCDSDVRRNCDVQHSARAVLRSDTSLSPSSYLTGKLPSVVCGLPSRKTSARAAATKEGVPPTATCRVRIRGCW